MQRQEQDKRQGQGRYKTAVTQQRESTARWSPVAVKHVLAPAVPLCAVHAHRIRRALARFPPLRPPCLGRGRSLPCCRALPEARVA
eukprot:795155-Rhodomonas_salina.1